MASIRAWQWSPASDYISCPRQPWHIDVVVRARLGISRHQLREVFGVGSNANSLAAVGMGRGSVVVGAGRDVVLHPGMVETTSTVNVGSRWKGARA